MVGGLFHGFSETFFGNVVALLLTALEEAHPALGNRLLEGVLNGIGRTAQNPAGGRLVVRLVLARLSLKAVQEFNRIAHPGTPALGFLQEFGDLFLVGLTPADDPLDLEMGDVTPDRGGTVLVDPAEVLTAFGRAKFEDRIRTDRPDGQRGAGGIDPLGGPGAQVGIVPGLPVVLSLPRSGLLVWCARISPTLWR